MKALETISLGLIGAVIIGLPVVGNALANRILKQEGRKGKRSNWNSPERERDLFGDSVGSESGVYHGSSGHSAGGD